MKRLLVSVGFLAGAAYVASMAAASTLLTQLFAIVFFVALVGHVVLA